MSRKAPRLTGEAARDVAFNAVDHAPLLAALGHDIPEELLAIALTHRSFASENGMLPNNERLEFLGDSILGVAIAAELYTRYPSKPESELAPMKSSLVSRFGLAKIARRMNLGDYILLGRGEQLSGGNDKETILADTMEAIFGALYITIGIEATRDVIVNLYDDLLDTATSNRIHADYKTELVQKANEFKGIVTYRHTQEGQVHEPIFTAIASVDGKDYGTGVGPSRRQAEQEAAKQAIAALNKQRPF